MIYFTRVSDKYEYSTVIQLMYNCVTRQRFSSSMYMLFENSLFIFLKVLEPG